MRKIFIASIFLFCAACSGKKQNGEIYSEKSYIMSVPVEVKFYSGDISSVSKKAKSIIGEAKRISDEFSYNEAYSQTSYVNKNAYEKWVNVDMEFINLLKISKRYYELTSGGFDPTFAPLWPIWKEAASKRKMPSQDEISKAISKIGYNNVIFDEQALKVIFLKPVELNLGGVLRGYAFYKIAEMLKKENINEKLSLDIGANRLCWGEGKWSYEVASPFDEKKIIGVLNFPSGVIVSSSGRSHFVEIEGKLYSHILNIKTGYPIENFSNLIVYLPDIKEDFISSAALAILGKEKAFEMVAKQKGACAVWIDGAGNVSYFASQDSLCKWEKPKKFKIF
ncbi:MAG: FAD:protein FMN transferase [Elusimicrobia bacterium]|nr:FAD:protein FMN transferase [Elusimicrobiota bacterium]